MEIVQIVLYCLVGIFIGYVIGVIDSEIGN